MDIKNLIERFPNSFRERLKQAYYHSRNPWRSKMFHQTYSFLQDSQWWNRYELENLQISQLKKLLKHAYENVPYYRRTFDHYGLKVEYFNDLKDIGKLPFLTKEIIRENLSDLKAKNLPKWKFRKLTTGGSSGTPLGLYNERLFSGVREDAFILSLWNRCGYEHGDMRLILKGPIPSSRNGMEYNSRTKELVCSTYDMDDEHLSLYFENMGHRKIKFIHGHASSIAIFANFLVRNGLNYKLQAVLGGGEKVFTFLRELVQKAFDTRLFSWYGQTEQVVLAGECEHSELYHIFPEYGVTELVDENGCAINTPGQSGEIVGTSFNNYAMPIIRYRTGDIAKYSSEKCNCGRQYDLFEKVEGRSYEYIFTDDGRRISLAGLILGQHFKAFERIKKMQLYQEVKGQVEMRLVKQPGYTKKDEAEIRNTILKAVSTGLELEFNYFDDIPLTSRGKHQFLVQKLPIALEAN